MGNRRTIGEVVGEASSWGSATVEAVEEEGGSDDVEEAHGHGGVLQGDPHPPPQLDLHRRRKP